MKVGYSFWGFLGDKKFDNNGKLASTPDGNAFYSWTIINKLIEDGNEVFRLMPNRDKIGLEMLKENLFSWCKEVRFRAISKLQDIYSTNVNWETITDDKLFSLWDEAGVSSFDIILHEWRMEIKGRNDDKAINPDLFIQNCLISYCKKNNIKLIIFDLDYKISTNNVNNLLSYDNIFIFELGFKLANLKKAYHVEIPFDFRFVDSMPFIENQKLKNNLVYIGNRYERDWCIDKYIPTNIDKVLIYGNWLEGGRDSASRWPKIEFKHRLQSYDMPLVYSSSICSILLAKEDYVQNHFMTARILEAVTFGTIPLFIEEYGAETIKKYAGELAKILTVKSKRDVINKIMLFKRNVKFAKSALNYLRHHLSFMDVKNFVSKIYELKEA